MTLTQRPQNSTLPDFIGRFLVKDTAEFLPLSHAEVIRSAEFVGNILDTYRFTSGRGALLTCQFEEAAQFVGVEDAGTERGLIISNAEASPYDGNRAESILRRFDIACVLGLNSALLSSIRQIDTDMSRVFSGRVVWARPDAYAELSGCEGFELRQWIEVGPAVALECSAGEGAHVDAREWKLGTRDGELVLTSRLLRSRQFECFGTGVMAHVIHDTCKCGLADPRIRLGSF